ncbi:H+/oligopeptide symporter [Handroanthus impetiginosus]|uniref:H+/oligopeptide symporter n=1 Tax=Handroanthus impetiginosus TaxID=429701 RepID=A0A2G9I5K8_9LAMI|nr:H+/oligopeptide symporter [Handroanthus impetiginosus]
MKSFVRISALLWADVLVAYAFFVMQKYLTDVWKLSFTHAAGILNIWGGIHMILPVFFLFVVDQFLGNFMMLVISSIAYSAGIGLIAMSTPPVLANSTNTCKQYEPRCIGHTQKVLFYTGMALVAVGMAGNLVSVKPFLKEQQDGSDDKAGPIDCLRIPGFILVVLVPVIGAFALPYVKPWSLRFGIPAICTAFATLLFFSGCCRYNINVDPPGSPLTNVCRVFVASASKISRQFPLDANRVHRGDNQNLQLFSRTRCLRCLEKAAIILDTDLEDHVQNRWRLCSIAEVEEAKTAVRMIPMWITFIVCGIVSSIGNTYFIEQANQMNRKLGNWKVPLQILLLFYKLARNFFSRLAVRFLKRPRKYAPSVGIAIAMILSILCCITAARIEKRRLNVIKSHGLLDKPKADIPMSVYWLLFQFFLLAGLDSFFEKSVAAFYKDQAPKSMRNYLSLFTKGVSGLGFMCGVLSVYVVGKVSERGERTNWFQYTLNRSRLDRYYWVLAALSSMNLVVFIIVASCYKYQNHGEAQDDEEVDTERPGQPTNAGDEGKCCYFF